MNNDDVKEKEQSLRDAVTALNVADVKRILRENPTLNVNLSLDPSNSLLHFAVRHDSLPIVQLLVERKADIEAKSVSVIPPLYWSAFHGFIEIVRYLCFVGADLYNAPSGWTPVHTAAGHNHDNVIELLATFGSSIDKLNSGSETPLKVAAGSRHHRAAHCLIALNANVSSSSASTNEFLRPILEQHPVAERETSRNEIINRTFQKNSILLMVKIRFVCFFS